jgi:hypothetical protein
MPRRVSGRMPGFHQYRRETPRALIAGLPSEERDG